MSQFYITNENTEDRWGSADNLEDAIRLAREVAQNEQTDGPVNIEYKGKNIRQFVLLPNGKVAEEILA